jgi:tetratricopeptide (TPR) repeat protein
MLAGVLAAQGQTEASEAAVATARELTDEDDVLSLVLWRTAHARLLTNAGRMEEAVAESEAAVAIAAGSADIDLLGDAKSELGDILCRVGRADDAGPPLREALALYERKGNLVSAERVRARLADLVTA